MTVTFARFISLYEQTVNHFAERDGYLFWFRV